MTIEASGSPNPPLGLNGTCTYSSGYTPQLRVSLTSSSGSFTVPAGTPTGTTYHYGLVGGGGSGFGTLYVSGSGTLAHGYGGGGGGQFVAGTITVNAGCVIHWVIGCGGAGVSGGAGGSGGNSWFFMNSCTCAKTYAYGGVHAGQRVGGNSGACGHSGGGQGSSTDSIVTASGGGAGGGARPAPTSTP